MFRKMYILFILPTLFACQSKGKYNEGIIKIHTEGISCDSIGYRVVNFIEGKELLDTILPIDSPLVLPNIRADMYLIALSWPRILIPHQIFRNKVFDTQVGDKYILTKALYINPEETNQYVLSMDSILTLEDIETRRVKEIRLKVKNCPSCLLAEKYWSNYNNFFGRKDSLVNQLNYKYYKSVDQNDKAVRQRFLEADSAKKNLQTDSMFTVQLDSLVRLNSNDPVSTFFVFYQLFSDRNFEKYRSIFSRLKGAAKKSRYYESIRKRY